MGVCAILHCSLLEQKSPDCPPPIARSAIASLLCTGNLVPRISAEEFCHQRGGRNIGSRQVTYCIDRCLSFVIG